MRALTPPPDAGAGVDASSAIGTCDGMTVGSGNGGGTPSGLGPADFAKLYDIPDSTAGDGKVVAIVDACSHPGVVADLTAYRSKYGLPALPQCGSANGSAPVRGGAACFGVVSQRGDATIGPPDSGWAGEIALDVEMVSAVCPTCSILLVEADSPNSWDLGPAVNEAITLGASAVSNSYGAPEDPNDPLGAAYSDGPYTVDYQHGGVLVAVASGDGLYNNQTTQNSTVLAPSFPSTIPGVLSVGGTTARAGSGTARGGYTETVWNNSGADGTTSGCSGEFAKPAFQGAIDMGSCNARADVDVAAVAQNVSTYVGGRWTRSAGTSCASPLVAALFTRIGVADRPNAFFYANGSAFYDVTSGNNDPSAACHDVMCTAGTGWDGPTGWGTPNATALLARVASDAGAVDDAGQGEDASQGVDSATSSDAGQGADTGHGDEGGAADAGHVDDGGSSEDASSGDAESPGDASVLADATSGQDSGSHVDATAPGDDGGSITGNDSGGSLASDAGGAEDDGGDGATGGSGGCSCREAGSPAPLQGPAAILVALGVGLAFVRRRR